MLFSTKIILFYFTRKHTGLYYGTKMRYFGIQVNLTVSVFTLGLTEGKPVYQAWEQLMTEAVSDWCWNITNSIITFQFLFSNMCCIFNVKCVNMVNLLLTYPVHEVFNYSDLIVFNSLERKNASFLREWLPVH